MLNDDDNDNDLALARKNGNEVAVNAIYFICSNSEKGASQVEEEREKKVHQCYRIWVKSDAIISLLCRDVTASDDLKLQIDEDERASE